MRIEGMGSVGPSFYLSLMEGIRATSRIHGVAPVYPDIHYPVQAETLAFKNDVRLESQAYGKVYRRDREGEQGMVSNSRFVERATHLLVVWLEGQRHICADLTSLWLRYKDQQLQMQDLSVPPKGIFIHFDRLPGTTDEDRFVLWDDYLLKMRLGNLALQEQTAHSRLRETIDALTSRFRIPHWPVSYFAAWETAEIAICRPEILRCEGSAGSYRFQIADDAGVPAEIITACQYLANNQGEFEEALAIMTHP